VNPAAPLRLVLDTNVWLDWLAFDDPTVAPIKRAQAEGVVEIFSDEACTRELIAVLNYDLGRRSLDAEKQAACLSTFHALVRTAPPRTSIAEASALPQCRDPDDQKFLELARDCGADYLVTKDKALLVLARRKARPAPCRIVTPLEIETILEISRSLV
jgi:putative PIN family toxin of toxin-antitoxin system